MSILDRTVKISRRAMTLFFLIDTSTSMEGSKIGAVNDAVENVLPMISEISSENPDAEIRIAALEFSSGTRWLYDEPKPASDFVWQDVQADGLTSMGEAFQELNGRMSAGSFMNGPCVAPVILLLSDGGPTDDYESGLDELKKNKWYRHAIKVAIAIGEDADRDVLAEFTGSKESVLTVHNIEALKQVIRIVAVTSSTVGSRSTTAGGSTKQGSVEAEVKEAVRNIRGAHTGDAPADKADSTDEWGGW